MSMSDPVADMLTRIRNAGMARHETVSMPFSTLKLGMTKIFSDEGYIKGFKVHEEDGKRVLRIFLKTAEGGRAAITGLRRVSKPGRRIYVKADKIPKVMSGLGVAVISSSRGVIADHDARTQGVGGELLCVIW